MTKQDKSKPNRKTKSKWRKFLCFLISMVFAFIPLIIYLIFRKKKKHNAVEAEVEIENPLEENDAQDETPTISNTAELVVKAKIEAKSGANLLAKLNEHIKNQEQRQKAEEEKQRLAQEEAKLKSEEEIGSMNRDFAQKSQQDSSIKAPYLKLNFTEVSKLNQNEQSRVLVVYIKKLIKITNNLTTKSISVDEALLIKTNMKHVYAYYDQLFRSDKTIREIAIEILFSFEEFKRNIKKFISALRIDKNLENSPSTAAYYKNPLTNQNERVSQALSFVIFKNYFVSFVPYENYKFAIPIVKKYCEWDEYVKEKLNQNIKVLGNRVVPNPKNTVVEPVVASENPVPKKKKKKKKKNNQARII